jgi:hypothetical protein
MDFERDRIQKLFERALDPSSEPAEREKALQALSQYRSHDLYIIHRDGKSIDRSLLNLTRELAADRKKLLARIDAQSQRIFFLEDQLAKWEQSSSAASRPEPSGKISQHLKTIARRFLSTKSVAARAVLTVDWRNLWEQTPQAAAQPKKKLKYGAVRAKGYIRALEEMIGVRQSMTSRISDAGTAGEMISRDILMGLIGTNLDQKKHLEMLKRMRGPDEVPQRRYVEERLVPTKLPKSKREQLQRIREFLTQHEPSFEVIAFQDEHGTNPQRTTMSARAFNLLENSTSRFDIDAMMETFSCTPST